jgi:hypothetical protein
MKSAGRRRRCRGRRRRAASRVPDHLARDGARHDVARQQLGRTAILLRVDEPAIGLFDGVGGLGGELRNVLNMKRSPSRFFSAAVAAHALGDQDAAHRRRPHHTGGMERVNSMSISSAPAS